MLRGCGNISGHTLYTCRIMGDVNAIEALHFAMGLLLGKPLKVCLLLLITRGRFYVMPLRVKELIQRELSVN
jgi:hypothetical protein